MKRWKRPLIALVLILATALAGITVVKKRKREIAQAPAPQVYPLPVETARVRKGSLEIKEHYLGTLSPMVSSRLAPRIMGHILEVKVREGDRVKKGEVLARLDDRPLVNQYQSIKAQLEGARSTLATLEAIYKRNLMLFENKAISQEELDRSRSARDEARARVETLKESLKTAQLNVEYSFIRAPMDGVITRRLQNPGDLGVPGKAILEMEAPQKGYKVVVKVPQELVGHLRRGDRVYLSPREGGPTVKASLSRIYPSVAVGTLAKVEVDVKAPPFGLPSGGTLDVALVTGRFQGLIVPLRALLHTTKGDLAFTVTRNNTVKALPVKVLGKGERKAVVLGALTPGTRVILGEESLLVRLHRGARVTPIKDEKL